MDWNQHQIEANAEECKLFSFVSASIWCLIQSNRDTTGQLGNHT